MAGRTQIAREVDTSAEHQVEALVEMQVQRRIAVHAVAVERVELLISREIGVVLAARETGVLLDVDAYEKVVYEPYDLKWLVRV